MPSPARAESSSWEEWVNLFAVTGRPVLLGFNAGAIARSSEASNDARLVASALAVLRNMFGRSLPNPTAWAVTRWSRDPFARGSYSCLARGSTLLDRSALAMPISPRLRLAGEACSVDHPATVHGAYSSGVAAANDTLPVLS